MDTYEDAKEAVTDAIEEALVDHFRGRNVEVIDTGIFSVQVEKSDGSHFVVEVRIA